MLYVRVVTFSLQWSMIMSLYQLTFDLLATLGQHFINPKQYSLSQTATIARVVYPSFQ